MVRLRDFSRRWCYAYNAGFWKPRKAVRTSFRVLLVTELPITAFPLRRIKVGYKPSPTLLILIPADMSRSTKRWYSSSQYSRIPQSVKTNSSLYGSNWEVYCGLTWITKAPAFSALNFSMLKNWPKAASAQDLFSPDFADCPLAKYFPDSSCFALFLRLNPARLSF